MLAKEKSWQQYIECAGAAEQLTRRQPEYRQVPQPADPTGRAGLDREPNSLNRATRGAKCVEHDIVGIHTRGCCDQDQLADGTCTLEGVQ
jgi:hypothetical protein